jgi:hypothetical protein
MKVGEYKVTIKRATMLLQMDRTDLIQVDQTPDGVAFTFRHGVHIIVSDQNMPNEAKDMMKVADQFPKGNIIFDLNSYKKPVYLEM